MTAQIPNWATPHGRHMTAQQALEPAGMPWRKQQLTVKPGRTTVVPLVVKVSEPAANEALLFLYTQSGDREPRKCRATKLQGAGWGAAGGWAGH